MSLQADCFQLSSGAPTIADTTHLPDLEKANNVIDPPSSVPQRQFQYNPLQRLGNDLTIQASAPFHMTPTQAIWVGAGIFTTAMLMISDQSTYNTVKEEQFDGKWISKVSPVVTQFGSNYGISVIGINALYGFVANDSKALETSYLASEAFLTSGIWGIVIKTFTGRQRPSTENEPGGEWFGPFAYFRRSAGQSISSFDSFPSGHTLTAFSIATVFAEQYGDHPLVPVFCYSAASLVALSRITENAHWASDVFVGGVLGYLTAEELITHNTSEYSRLSSQHAQCHLTIAPGILNDRPAVQMQLQF